MAVVYLTGAESGLSNANGAGLVLGTPAQSNSSVATTAGRVKSGTYAHRLNNPGASTVAVRGFVNIAAAGACNGGFWLILEDLPAADRQLFTIQGATTEDAVIQYDQGTGKLAGFDPTNGQIGIFSSCPVLSADTFYWVAWKVDRTANTLSITITPAGGSAVDCGSLTNATGWTNNNGWVAIGNDQAQGAFDAYYDDVIVCSGGTEYPLGPHEILAVTVGSDGTHSFTDNDFSTGDAGTLRAASYTDFWQMLDDAVPWTATRSTTDNVAQRASRAAGYVEVVIAPTASGKPNALAVRALLAYSATGTSTNQGKCEVRNSAGTAAELWGIFPSTTRDYSESSNFFKGAIVPAPAGGWTKSELDQIRFRLGGSADVLPIPTWQALLVEIAYPLSTSKEIDAQPGSFAIAGVANGMVYDHPLNAASASYALTGEAASTLVGRAVDAQPGSFAITGNAASLLFARLFDAQPGSYAIAGADATLAKGRQIDAQPGAYAIAGAEAALLRGLATDAQPGAFAVAGADAQLVKGYELNAQPGALEISGGQTVKVFDMAVSGANTWFSPVTVDPSTDYVFSFYAKRGDSTDVEYSVFDVTHGADLVSPTDYFADVGVGVLARIEVPFTTPAGCTQVNVYLTRDSDAAGSTFVAAAQVEEGTAATTWQRTSGGAGSVNLLPEGEDLDTSPWATFGGVTMTDTTDTATVGGAELVYTQVAGSFTLDCQPGTFAITGDAAGALADRVLSALAGSYTITGVAASPLYGRALSADPGSYAIAGSQAGAVVGRAVDAQPGAYLVTGDDAGVPAGRTLELAPGAFQINGAPVTILAGTFAVPARTTRTRTDLPSGATGRVRRGKGQTGTQSTSSDTHTLLGG